MQPRLKFLMGLVAFTVVQRVLPYFVTNHDIKLNPLAIFYPWNFSPLMAVSLFSGAYLADRRLKFGLPLLVLFISDLGITLKTGQLSSAFQLDGGLVYACILAAAWMGQGLDRRDWPLRDIEALGRGMVAEILFFIVTNFGYFCFQTDLPHTSAGLMACYVAAIPFAGRSFASTAFYSVLIFSPLAVKSTTTSTRTEPRLQTDQSLYT